MWKFAEQFTSLQSGRTISRLTLLHARTFSLHFYILTFELIWMRTVLLTTECVATLMVAEVYYADVLYRFTYKRLSMEDPIARKSP